MPRYPSIPARSLLAEVHAAKSALDSSLAGLRRAANPVNRVARLARRPVFPAAIVAVGIAAGIGIALTVARRRRDEKSWRHLPEKLAEALHLRHEKPTQPTGRQRRLLKAAASIALKASTPVLLGVLRHHFAPGRPGGEGRD